MIYDLMLCQMVSNLSYKTVSNNYIYKFLKFSFFVMKFKFSLTNMLSKLILKNVETGNTSKCSIIFILELIFK